jgi:hypothetical protein
MAVSAAWYGKGLEALFGGAIDLDSDTFKIALVTSAYSPNYDADDNFTVDIQGNEASGSGYSAGGATLASLAITVDGADNEVQWDADNVIWSTSTVTDMPIILVNFGEDKASSAGDFTISFHADGIGKASY